MRSTFKKIAAVVLCCFVAVFPAESRADIFGGDVAVLLQILAQAIDQVIKLQQLLSTSHDTLGLLQDINSGVRSGLDIIRVVNPKFNPGVYGDLRDPANVLRALHDLYGAIPQQSSDQGLMESQDQSVAEVISMNRNLYDYADQVDQERERILMHSQVVSPQGAGKLQAQSLAVLIGVMTQLLRTQSQMLKLMGQNMALENRKEKVSSQEFIDNYHGVSNGLKNLPTDLKLPTLNDGGQ
jgi:hypothetical protein